MTDKQKQALGAFLAITLVGILIWYLFFGGKNKVKVTNPLRRVPKNPVGVSTPSSGSNNGGNTNYNSGGSRPQPKISNGNDFPIQPGSRGEAVKDLQEALEDAGYRPGPIDGAWGPQTTAAFNQAFPGTALGINSNASWEWHISQLFGRGSTLYNEYMAD